MIKFLAILSVLSTSLLSQAAVVHGYCEIPFAKNTVLRQDIGEYSSLPKGETITLGQSCAPYAKCDPRTFIYFYESAENGKTARKCVKNGGRLVTLPIAFPVPPSFPKSPEEPIFKPTDEPVKVDISK